MPQVGAIVPTVEFDLAIVPTIASDRPVRLTVLSDGTVVPSCVTQ